MVSFSSIIFASGTIVLLHSAYSCVHYRNLLQVYDEAVSGISTDVMETSDMKIPPNDVLIESMIGFIFILFAELIRPGSNLQPAVAVATKNTTTTKKQQPLVAPAYMTRDFDIYHTRTRALYEQKKL